MAAVAGRVGRAVEILRAVSRRFDDDTTGADRMTTAPRQNSIISPMSGGLAAGAASASAQRPGQSSSQVPIGRSKRASLK